MFRLWLHLVTKEKKKPLRKQGAVGSLDIGPRKLSQRFAVEVELAAGPKGRSAPGS